MKKTNYLRFIADVKNAILKSRYSAARMVNRELIALYWRVGKMLSEKIEREKWGAKVVERIAKDLHKELRGLRGFSSRNLKNMRQFYTAYRMLPIGQLATAQLSLTASGQIGQLTTAQLEKTPSKEELAFLKLFFETGFTHHIIILNKCRNWEESLFYLQQCSANNWTVNLLMYHLETGLYKRKGKIQNNFNLTLPEHLRQDAIDAFRDEYLLDFINIDPNDERVLEKEIVTNIRNFILSLGKGFTFIGNQHRLMVEEDEFWVDLLFYNRHLQAMVAVDLKTGKFKPEYAGKMNFYLSALDAQEKLKHENPSIGIILCKEKSGMIVEYTFRDMHKPIGVATYKASKHVPEKLKKYLPKPDDLKKLMK
jgi:predicted nuclease of restriction endonuclease-like (RecB) superfamily